MLQISGGDAGLAVSEDPVHAGQSRLEGEFMYFYLVLQSFTVEVRDTAVGKSNYDRGQLIHTLVSFSLFCFNLDGEMVFLLQNLGSRTWPTLICTDW